MNIVTNLGQSKDTYRVTMLKKKPARKMWMDTNKHSMTSERGAEQR